ncbi:phage tail protein [Celerinatantimonas sp. MCCC 1A17872]|uniref:phage tail protein n=1 Tax=Celerinatantimonas sp. MCCC 1A17872 TaxID=3177514 RepID=UPI0038CB5833
MSAQSSDDFISVQPENRTVVEEALEYAWNQLIAALPDPYPNLKQPLETAAEFVDLIAQERGVLDYQPGDTLAQKRNTTDQAFQIHSKAGTRSGLKDALDALGFNSSVEKADEPYAITVIADIEADSLTEALQQRLEARVTAYKSERDSVGVDVVRGSQVPIYTGILTETGVVNDCVPYTNTETTSDVATPMGLLNETYILLDSEPGS